MRGTHIRHPKYGREVAIIVLFLTFLGFSSLIALAQQGRGSITGTVADTSGAMIPGAKIVATNTGTGQVREVLTAKDGTYTVPLLPIGTYTVSVSRSGFRAVTRNGVVVSADHPAAVDITLQIGAVNTTVTVNANAKMITTTKASIGQLINAQTVSQLPLDGRNPATLVFLAPGAANGLSTSGFALENWCCGFDTETGASINGGRQGSVLYLLNGANNMEAWEYMASPFPNPDATEEFQVITNNYGPQYGFASGGVVSIVTKSGTNQWHGDAFEFLRNNAFNAASFFGHTVDPLKRNQFGGSLGGKIIKNKLFIFGNYQQTINHSTSFGTVGFVPSNAMLNGDFSALLSHGIQLRNQNGQPYPNNFIDPTTFNPISMKILELGYPRTSDPLGETLLPGIVDDDGYKEGTLKTDFYASSRDHFGVTDYVDNYSRPPEYGGGDFLLSQISRFYRYNFHSINWTHTFGPTVLNNFVFGYNRTGTSSFAAQKDKNGNFACWPCYGMKINDFNQWNPNLDGWGVAGMSVNFGNNNIVPRYDIDVTDSVTLTKGAHLIVAGVDVLRQNMKEETDFIARPLLQFTGQYTGYGMADFMTGQLQSFSQAGGELGQVIGNQYSFYGGDTFRLKPNFTLDYGLRWEPFYPSHNVDGRMTLFRPGQQSTRFPNAPLGLVFPGDQGVPSGGFPNQVANFLPRLGVAWQPKRLPNTSIRAAFGIFFLPNAYSDYAHSWDGSPFSPEYILTGGAGPGQALNETDPFAGFAPTGGVTPYPSIFPWAPAVPPKDATFLPPFSLQTSFPGNFREGRTQSWNFSIEHEFTPNVLFRVAYVGTESYHLENPTDLNPGYYSAGGARLRFPNYEEILSIQGDGTASYNGLELTFQKRFSHGLQVTSNYTWSKNIDSNSQGSTAWAGSIGNPFDISWNRGLSNLNLPYIWSTTWVYHLPELAQYGRFMSTTLGGWEFSGIWSLQAGPDFSIPGGNGNNNSLSMEGGDRADLTGQPFDVQQGPKSHWIQQYFNPAAFKQNAPGTFGDSARNLFRSQNANNFDLGIDKNFPFKERYNVQFRWEMFNAFNRTQMCGPDSTVTDVTFGQIFCTQNGPRVMQLALKFTF